jgi:hypothetical protein
MPDKAVGTKNIMFVGYREIVNSHLSSTRRSKNRNAEIALERLTTTLATITIDALVAKGTGNGTGNNNEGKSS